MIVGRNVEEDWERSQVAWRVQECVCVTLRWGEERVSDVMVVVREVSSDGCEGL